MFEELNQHTGLLLFLCFIALVVCYRAIVVVGTAVEHFHKDYREVNQLDERKDLERGINDKDGEPSMSAPSE